MTNTNVPSYDQAEADYVQSVAHVLARRWGLLFGGHTGGPGPQRGLEWESTDGPTVWIKAASSRQPAITRDLGNLAERFDYFGLASLNYPEVKYLCEKLKVVPEPAEARHREHSISCQDCHLADPCAEAQVLIRAAIEEGMNLSYPREHLQPGETQLLCSSMYTPIGARTRHARSGKNGTCRGHREYGYAIDWDDGTKTTCPGLLIEPALAEVPLYAAPDDKIIAFEPMSWTNGSWVADNDTGDEDPSVVPERLAVVAFDYQNTSKATLPAPTSVRRSVKRSDFVVVSERTGPGQRSLSITAASQHWVAVREAIVVVCGTSGPPTLPTREQAITILDEFREASLGGVSK